MYDVSVSSMYGEPYHRPSMRRRGSVMRNCSFAPPGRSTVSTACPICFTMMLPPAQSKYLDYIAGRGGRRTREGRLLRAVALEDEPLGRVRDVVRGDGRVVRDLLDDEVGLSAAVDVGPVAVEQSAGNSSDSLVYK